MVEKGKIRGSHAPDLRAWDNAHVWHPFTPMQAFVDEEAPIITAAEGFSLIDAAGRRYLDGVSSLWCNVHGHRVPEIDAAIREQLDRVAHTTLLGLSSEPSIRLARELVRRTPQGLNRVFYSDSGSTAVEAGLKIAFQYHRQNRSGGSAERKTFVRLGQAYHGDTVGSVSLGGITTFHDAYGPLLFPTLEVPTPVAYRTPPGHTPESYSRFCLDELERVVMENGERIAAFVIEPLVQGAAGMLVHPAGYLKRVRELTAAHGILLIADEVAVGFGRTGTMFACAQENVQPDIMCVAKGITAGYLPLAATLTTDDVFGAFLGEPHEGRTFFHGHTYTGNPLGCAAALASLELFDRNDVLLNVYRNAERLAERLAELTGHPHVGDVRQKGIMAGVELVRDRDGDVPFPAEMRLGHRVTLAARERGVITRPLGDVVVLMPAQAMPGELIDELCDAVFESIDEATRE
ncbi:MAG: adenosylmethionine--8-amino-7-oxononanoate transaminase [Planctomycetaceae bacterium]